MRINYKSDFDVILDLRDSVAGESIGIPNCSWRAVFTTGNSLTSRYVASRFDGVNKNWYPDEGRLHVVFDGHKLGPGALSCEFQTYVPDPTYPDGFRKTVHTYALDVELTEDECDMTVTDSVTDLKRSVVESIISHGVEAYDTDSVAELAGKISNSLTRDDGGMVSLATVDVDDTGAEVFQQYLGYVKGYADSLGSVWGQTELETFLEKRIPFIPDVTLDNASVCNISNRYIDANHITTIGNVTISGNAGRIFDFMSNLVSIASIDTAPGTTLQLGLIFNACENLRSVNFKDTAVLDLTDTGEMFNRCYALEKYPNVDLSSTEYGVMMFEECTSLKEVPDIDVGMGIYAAMFANCSGLRSAGTLTVCDNAGQDAMNLIRAFAGCTSLESAGGIVSDNFEKTLMITSAFQDCVNLKRIGRIVGGYVQHGMTFSGCANLERIDEIDVRGGWELVIQPNIFEGAPNIKYLLFKNLGMARNTILTLNDLPLWGSESEENRRSLVDSLLTYSVDRTVNTPIETLNVRLAEETFARLTEAEVAQITAKGIALII